VALHQTNWPPVCQRMAADRVQGRQVLLNLALIMNGVKGGEGAEP
jgi:hypothetical protein